MEVQLSMYSKGMMTRGTYLTEIYVVDALAVLISRMIRRYSVNC